MMRLVCGMLGHHMTRTLVRWGLYDHDTDQVQVEWVYSCLRCSYQYRSRTNVQYFKRKGVSS